MSRHEGVSCDSCQKSNFTGNRFKCLVCYDYDLCSICHLAKVRSTRHSPEHPMQCILTRTDFEIYHGGETVVGAEPQYQSYTCPLCGRLGLTESQLQEHVNIEHADSNAEVICPVCACYTNGDPNQAIDDLAAHLMLEHRSAAEFETHVSGMRAMRRIAHHGRGAVASTRTRRPNIPPSQTPGGASNGVASSITVLPAIERQRYVLSERDRETGDPIAELLTQSLARRNTTAAHTISSQLQQLEVQLQSTRQQAERLLPNQMETFRSTATITFPQSSVTANLIGPSVISVTRPTAATASNNRHQNRSRFILSRLEGASITEEEREAKEEEAAARSLFVQELLLSSLTEPTLSASDDDDDDVRPSLESFSLNQVRTGEDFREPTASSTAAATSLTQAAADVRPAAAAVDEAAGGAGAAVSDTTEAAAAAAGCYSTADAEAAAAAGGCSTADSEAAAGGGCSTADSEAAAAGGGCSTADSEATADVTSAASSSLSTSEGRADGVTMVTRPGKVRSTRRSGASDSADDSEPRRVASSSSSSVQPPPQGGVKRKPVVGRPSKEQSGKFH